MDEQAFWSVIDETRRASIRRPRLRRRGAGGDLERHGKLLQERLERHSADDIVAFDRLWREKRVAAYRWDLWAAAYVINGGCSDDCFSYFRDYVISLGEPTYTAALGDPDSLAEVVPAEEEIDWEVVSYAAHYAYERVAGGELPASGPWDPPQPAGEEWAEEDAARLVPRLAAKFNW